MHVLISWKGMVYQQQECGNKGAVERNCDAENRALPEVTVDGTNKTSG